MGSPADKNVIRFHSFFFNLSDFFQESLWVYNNPVCDDAFSFTLQNAGRQKVEYKFFFTSINGVTRIISALKAYHVIRFCRQNVCYFTFAFVPILKTYNYIS